ncbi:MAG: apolipoprotein N-acyltransferase [Sandarakinorhabdus sp.]|nr:apolipoprotein N-acyltransferase [Sandarakinorhabdus sp.]
MPRSRLLLSLAALAAGALSAIGFAPLDLWPATLIGLAILIGLVGAAPRPRTAFLYGWLFGTGHFAIGLTWIATAFTFQAKMPQMLGWLAVVLLSMFLALYVGLASMLTRRIARGTIGRSFVFAAAWMLGEWLRGWVFSGFAWNPLGAAALPIGGLGQLAAFIGALGLSGVIGVAGGSLWAMIEPKAPRRQRLIGAALASSIAIAAGIASTIASPASDPGNPVIVIIQPNIGQDVKYAPGADEAHLQTYLQMTRDGLSRIARRPALVLWSESAVFGLPQQDPQLRARLAAVLGPGDLLLFGGVEAIRDINGQVTALTNSLFVIDATGVLHGRYDKAHLVPLGEYVPMRTLMEAIGLARLTPGDIDFQPGPGPRTLVLPGMPAVGGQICYEIIFAGAVVDPDHRPLWIANISNDAWFGPTGPPQHLAQTRLRAIEEGLPMARATPTGISAVTDARGHVIATSRLGEQVIISATLPSPLPPTVFARLGQWASAGFGVVLLVIGIWVGRRSRVVE